MVLLASALIGGGIGALVGAAIQSTEKGKEMDKQMRESWKTWNEDVKDKIPWDKVGELAKIDEK